MIPPSVPRSAMEGLDFESFSGQLRTSFRKIGVLITPSGRVAAGDPDYLKDLKPFDLAIPGRSVPVILTLARYPDKDERVAAARLELGGGEVAEWREAHPESYGVDSGLGCFLDAQAASRLNRQSVKALERHRDALRKAVEKNYADTRSWASLAIDPATGANLIAFSAGFGDGGYGSYIGLDRAGKPVTLLTDFGLLLNQEEIDAMDEEL